MQNMGLKLHQLMRSAQDSLSEYVTFQEPCNTIWIYGTTWKQALNNVWTNL